MAPSRPETRVLRIITRLNIGGPAIQATTLADRLTPRGFRTRLLYGRLGTAEGDMKYMVAPEVDAVEIPSLERAVAPARDARTLAELVRQIREFQPHIVHTHMAKAGSLGRTAAALVNRTRAGRARIIHTYHGHVLDGYFSPAKTRLFLGIERSLARLTDRIVAVSPAVREELLREHRIGRADQYRVIPLGLDLRPFAAIDRAARIAARVTLEIPQDVHVVATVGRLTAIKQHDLFLDTARRIAAADPGALFLVAGDGELRSALERQAEQLGIAGRVRFLGWRRDLSTIYAATDVFLLTSRNEGTPVALIESLAAATPGVATDVGGVKDVLDTESGLLAPFGDAERLAARVLALLGDPAHRTMLGQRGRHSVLARYDIDRLVDDVDRLYRDVLE